MQVPAWHNRGFALPADAASASTQAIPAMKKLILLALLVYLGWQYKHPQIDETRLATNAAMTQSDQKATPSVGLLATAADSSPARPVGQLTQSSQTFRCDGRTHCSQMTSCAEATYFLKNCPNTQMDGDGDGVPCERQWCGGR